MAFKNPLGFAALLLIALCLAYLDPRTNWDRALPDSAMERQDPAANSNDPVFAHVLEVIDGDTLKVNINGRERNLRLIGVDAPEARENQKLSRDAQRTRRDKKTIMLQGQISKEYLQKLIRRGALLRLEYDVERKDRYDRVLAYAYMSDGTMLNLKILRDGYANLMTVPPNVRHVSEFKAALKLARQEGRGLWSSDSK